MPFNSSYFGARNSSVENRPRAPTGLAPPYDGPSGPAGPVYGQLEPPYYHHDPSLNKQQPKASVLPRITMSALTSCCLFATVIFLIMVEIGNTYDKAVLRDIWFIKFDFSNISPVSNSTPGLGYGLAESFGFYDFYQVGLWNYCQGNNGTGIASCTAPDPRYWFDPIAIFANQIEDGTVTVPADFYDSLDEIKICSHWMFGLFMTGACLSFVLIPIVLAGVRSRWVSLGLGIITFLNALCVLAATVIATVMFVLLRDLLRDYVEIINLVPTIGSTMFAMMWIATAFALIAFFIQAFLSCFCASKRDAQRGITAGRFKSYL